MLTASGRDCGTDTGQASVRTGAATYACGRIPLWDGAESAPLYRPRFLVTLIATLSSRAGAWPSLRLHRWPLRSGDCTSCAPIPTSDSSPRPVSLRLMALDGRWFYRRGFSSDRAQTATTRMLRIDGDVGAFVARYAQEVVFEDAAGRLQTAVGPSCGSVMPSSSLALPTCAPRSLPVESAPTSWTRSGSAAPAATFMPSRSPD